VSSPLPILPSTASRTQSIDASIIITILHREILPFGVLSLAEPLQVVVSAAMTSLPEAGQQKQSGLLDPVGQKLQNRPVDNSPEAKSGADVVLRSASSDANNAEIGSQLQIGLSEETKAKVYHTGWRLHALTAA